MKVNVLQVDDVSFRSRWSFWSKWVDVAVYDYGYTPYLLQMRVNRINRKKFKSTRITGLVYRQATAAQIGDLTQMHRPSA